MWWAINRIPCTKLLSVACFDTMAASESETSLSPAEEAGNSTSNSRKRRRNVAFDNFMEGRSRKAYRVQQDIEDAQMRMDSTPNLSVKVCHSSITH